MTIRRHRAQSDSAVDPIVRIRSEEGSLLLLLLLILLLIVLLFPQIIVGVVIVNKRRARQWLPVVWPEDRNQSCFVVPVRYSLKRDLLTPVHQLRLTPVHSQR